MLGSEHILCTVKRTGRSTAVGRQPRIPENKCHILPGDQDSAVYLEQKILATCCSSDLSKISLNFLKFRTILRVFDIKSGKFSSTSG